MRSSFGRPVFMAMVLLGEACGNGNTAPIGGAGGGAGSGGSSGGTGAAGSGGMTSSGGAGSAVASGGAAGQAGTGGSGGATPNGGVVEIGGGAGAGGASAAGGSTRTPDAGAATGGTSATAGATATETGPATGGVPASGGVAGSSGAGGGTGGRATGGTAGTSRAGGSPATGGAGGAGGTTGTTCGSQPTLRKAADCTGRLIGVALSTQHLSESAYANAAKEFNYVTPENEMKWGSIEPTRGQFSFGGGDQIVSFANSNGMKVKGHALVWHNQLPSWASAINNATDARAAMLAHIKGVMQHYKGKVHAWDVVNEAVALDGKGLRDYVFPKYLGETFIDEAFQAAREADPDAKLYYNDYNCEGLSLKANTVYELVKGMKARNVPFDGVGMQMHYGEPNEAVPLADFVANLQRYADLGLDILISEMDVHVCAGLSPTQQQALYHDLIAACVGQPRCIAATFWGITDKYSWLNDEPDLGCSGGQKPLGLLWDDSYKKKPAYTGVMNALIGL